MRLPPLAPDATFAPLVLDCDGAEARRFRMSASGPHRCSGSAQFSLAAWEDLQTRLGRPPPDALYVLDLRQESHGFLEGMAVSWYARHNWGCVGLAEDERRGLESLRLRMLERGERVWLADAKSVKTGTGAPAAERMPGRARTEEEALGLAAGHYVRLPVADHTRPEDWVLERFVRFVRELRGEAHLHLHCRGGKGRTSLFLSLHALLWNARHLSLEAVLEQQALLNDYDLRRMPARDSYKAPFAPERLELLERFHAYARANPGGWPDAWPGGTTGTAGTTGTT